MKRSKFTGHSDCAILRIEHLCGISDDNSGHIILELNIKAMDQFQHYRTRLYCLNVENLSSFKISLFSGNQFCTTLEQSNPRSFGKNCNKPQD